ncbi:centrosomal protein of 295 kDa-like [Cyprinus carpio]|uniref:Centrosomal protein of 295 kDa-like n=1 Tax=Cyprinus carpio TaxID=7962 RepID=A0A9Q9YUI8_CYPCA|nr:centrosomal protein of 295 kDa-like [Cyprinus carpio]
MSGRVSVRLSPNEEAQLERQELHRRRKLRLQQVREQERFIARQVRAQVQERRQQQLQTLADLSAAPVAAAADAQTDRLYPHTTSTAWTLSDTDTVQRLRRM